MPKKLSAAQKRARLVRTNGKTPQERGEAIERAIKAARLPKVPIDFVRSVRGR